MDFEAIRQLVRTIPSIPTISTRRCTGGNTPNADPRALHTWAARGYSQLGADGILHKLFHDIGTTNKYYVEFGTQSGVECNTRRLREVCGWSGLLMDGGYANASINLHKAFITRENIASLFRKHGVPRTFDLLSVDIDGNDYHVLREVLRQGYAPRVVMVETNFRVRTADAIIAYDPYYKGVFSVGNGCYGSASVAAFRAMMGARYTHVASHKPDAYWVRNDVDQPIYEVPDISDEYCELALSTTARGRHKPLHQVRSLSQSRGARRLNRTKSVLVRV